MADPKPRSAGSVPFGYKLHPTNPKLIEEDVVQQEVLKELPTLSKLHSLRRLVDYIQYKTERRMTPRGVSKVLKRIQREETTSAQ